MPTICCPSIAKDDFETFRRLMNADFPRTYDEWLKLTSKKADDLIAVGNAIKRIDLHADEFAQFLRATGTSPDLKSLWHFAHEKFMGRKY